MYFVERPDQDKPFLGLTARKNWAECIRGIFAGKETYPEEDYVLCSRILRTYGKLSVRIDGKEPAGKMHE